MSRIRITHIVRGLWSGGTERALLRVVSDLDPDRFEHTICTLVGHSLDPMGRARIVNMGRSLEARGLLLPALMRVFLREKPHIVHSRNWATIEAVPAAHLAGVPAVVHSEHGRDMEAIVNGQPWRRRVLRRWCFGWANRVFAVSQELRDYYVVQLGVPASLIEVIPNGVDTGQFWPDPEARRVMRARLGVADRTLLVGSVGRLVPIKDYPTLFRAADQLAAEGMDLRVALVGPSGCAPHDGQKDLQQGLASLPRLAERVIFPGESDEVANWLNAFDAFVLPSLSEGMSNTVLEAMATGLPVIATRVGSNPDIIEDGTSGILFEPRDAAALAGHLRALAASPELRRRLGLQARARVERSFSQADMTQRYATLYSEVLRGKGRAIEPALGPV